MLIDSHCHIDVDAFDHDREQVITRAHLAGVKKIIVPAIQSRTWDRLLAICAQHKSLYPALGLHPLFSPSHTEPDFSLLEKYIQDFQPIAVGEIGLDFYSENADREKQLLFFNRQLELAQQISLPVILHVRKAHDQILESLKQIRVTGGVCHAFNGSMQQAEQYIELGFKLGFGGMLSYERSTRLRRLAAELPLESIVLETDAPDMTVASHQGERNSPEYLPECLLALARVRGLEPSQVASATTENCLQVFHLD